MSQLCHPLWQKIVLKVAKKNKENTYSATVTIDIYTTYLLTTNLSIFFGAGYMIYCSIIIYYY